MLSLSSLLSAVLLFPGTSQAAICICLCTVLYKYLWKERGVAGGVTILD
jgi:hypothetical protein